GSFRGQLGALTTLCVGPRALVCAGANPMEPQDDEAARPSDEAPQEEAASFRPELESGPGFVLPRAAPKGLRVIVVSGAKGGVGKSLVATNLAIYLATIGRKVVVVDADADGANLHTFLGVERPEYIGSVVPPLPSFRSGLPTARPSEGPKAAQPRRIPPLGLGRVQATPAPEPRPAPGSPVPTAVPGLSLLHAGLDEP